MGSESERVTAAKAVSGNNDFLYAERGAQEVNGRRDNRVADFRPMVVEELGHVEIRSPVDIPRSRCAVEQIRRDRKIARSSEAIRES